MPVPLPRLAMVSSSAGNVKKSRSSWASGIPSTTNVPSALDPGAVAVVKEAP